MSGKVNVGIGKLQGHVQSSQNRICIRNGKVVNADGIVDADIYIEGGVIKDMGQNLIVPGGVKVIEAKGKLVLPGGVDPQTHMQMATGVTISSDDFYSGTKAALAGGTTTIMDVVSCCRGKSLIEAYDQHRQQADSKVCCDYALHVMVSHYDDKVGKEMETLVKEKGVNSFLFQLATPGLEDDELYQALRKCRELGALAMVHAENGRLIQRRAEEIFAQGVRGPEGHLYSHPVEGECEATHRVCTLASLANCPLYVVSVSSAETAAILAKARREGALVTGETPIAALGASGCQYFHADWKTAAAFVTSPPLRDDPTVAKKLAHHLAAGDLECVSSNHCPFKTEQRALGKDDFRKIPQGVNGVEDRLSVLWEKTVVSGLLDPSQFVSVTSTNAAKLFNVYPRKGRVAVGSDADVVVWDAEATRSISAKSHHQNVDHNIFEGLQCHGKPVAVISRGHLILEESDGELRCSQGTGSFLPTSASAPHLFARVAAREKNNVPKAVSREAYSGAVVDLSKVCLNDTKPVAPAPAPVATTPTPSGDQPPVGAANQPGSDAFHNRPPTRSGGRHMQDSTFTFSGEQVDDKQPARSSIRTHHPPGGASSGSLW